MSKLLKFKNTFKTRGLSAAFGLSMRYFFRTLKIPIFVQPYDFIQSDVEKNLHKYLNVKVNEIGLIVTVGAHMGHETKRIMNNFPKVKCILFEASPRYSKVLKEKFIKLTEEGRVDVHELAVSDVNKYIDFHETNLEGSGSILKVDEAANLFYGMENVAHYSVRSVRLDEHGLDYGYGTSESLVDCLWIDVQGAELQVLRGAQGIMQYVKSIFIEVALFKPLYQQGANFDQINSFLIANGFVLVSLGTDPLNGTGNAFFIKNRINNL